MGRNGVKFVTAIRTPLLARVRSLRHGFITVITGITALGPGDSRFLKSSFSLSYWIADSTASQSRALGPGDSSGLDRRLHRRTCTTCEFAPVTRIYSNPSWNQYLTVGMARIRRGLTSPLYPEWCVPPRAFKYNDESRHPERACQRERGVSLKLGFTGLSGSILLNPSMNDPTMPPPWITYWTGENLREKMKVEATNAFVS
ncbi:hypothetical protein PIB30_049346 [Stylosanthes scabra]|uniref:Uncharacterized protein n=1 Tax=Stylosanthes scabra TaxID=79078 RepID=A0ABU6QGQ8_9FABA|nr:hypothetical protein [Stylosanthes scabra]